MNIFLSCKINNSADYKFVQELKKVLSKNSFSVALPEEKDYWKNRQEKVFKADIMIVLMDDGRNNEWTGFDLGTAQAHNTFLKRKKLIIGYYYGVKNINSAIAKDSELIFSHVVSDEKKLLNLVKTYMVVDRKRGTK